MRSKQLIRCGLAAHWAVALSASILFVGAARGDAVDDVIAKLEAAHARTTSYTARVRSTQEYSDRKESIRIETQGSVEWKRDGEKILFRSEAEDNALRKRGADLQQHKSKSLFVSDGSIFWAQSEDGGNVNVMMAKPDPLLVGSPKAMVDKFRPDHQVTLLKDEAVDGADCHVIELKPLAIRDQNAARIVLFYRKDSGLNVQHVGYDAQGRKVSEKTLLSVKVNVDIPPERFTYTVPEGVNVMDFINNPEPAP